MKNLRIVIFQFTLPLAIIAGALSACNLGKGEHETVEIPHKRNLTIESEIVSEDLQTLSICDSLSIDSKNKSLYTLYTLKLPKNEEGKEETLSFCLGFNKKDDVDLESALGFKPTLTDGVVIGCNSNAKSDCLCQDIHERVTNLDLDTEENIRIGVCRN